VDWRVRFVDYPEQWRRQKQDLLPVIEDTIARGDLVHRQQLRDFEEHLAAANGSARAVGVSNCTDGLRLLAHALDIGPGDEIVSVAHTSVATISPFALRGATPVLVDVGDDHLMDTERLFDVVNDRTRAIVPVHLNGRTVDMAAVQKAADTCGAVVIEDAAEALGATFDGRAAGTFGVAAAYSFHPAKTLGALGDAGAVLTDDHVLADRLVALRDHGRIGESELDGWGYNCRLDNLQAAVLDHRLARVPEWIERRRAVARLYTGLLKDVTELEIPVGPDDDPQRRDVFQNYAIASDWRDPLSKHLREDGVETMVSWPIPLHRQLGLGLGHHRLPRTEELCDRVLSLPMHAELSDDQVEFVAASIRRFFER
jgi:dTDP-4-amino-4,6-dideoxygalactose transaminase